jgi:multidrug efflux pump subunit AcrA (membrane-fusion protein)
LGASLISGAGKSSSQPGYIPIYFTFNNDGTFIPGSMVEVYLIGASRDNVISVPVTALSEQQGDHFVYIKLDEEGYVKAPVKLGTRDGVRVEILDGVHAGDQVVVQGTTTVRLAETSSVVPEGHSHNH